MKNNIIFVFQLFFTSKHNGLVFMRLDKKQQLDLIERNITVCLNIRYIGVDKKAVDVIKNKLERFSSDD